MTASRSSAIRAVVRESKTVTSNRKANTKAATAVAATFRPVERERIIAELHRRRGAEPTIAAGLEAGQTSSAVQRAAAGGGLGAGDAQPKCSNPSGRASS